MTLPSSWTSLPASDLDARDDGDSQVAVKVRDRQHLVTEQPIDLSFPESSNSSIFSYKNLISQEYRFFVITAEKLLFRFDAKSGDGATAIRIQYLIAPVGGGSSVSGTIDTGAFGTGYTRSGVVITLNDDIRDNLAQVTLNMQTLSDGVTVTMAGSQYDGQAVISRTYRDTD